MVSRTFFALALCLFCTATALGLPASADPGFGHEEPDGVQAVCGISSAGVSWNPVPPVHLLGYDVFHRAQGGTVYVRANAAPVTETGYDMLGLNPGTTYEFRVVAVYDDGLASGMSEPAGCTTG